MSNINYMINNSSWIAKVFIVGLISFLLFLNYTAASWGLADLLAKQANYKMQRWEQSRLTVKPTDWDSNYTKLIWARYFQSYQPNLLEFIGKAYYLLSTFSVSIDKKTFYLQQALNYNLAAIQERPVSAYTWANIAILKYLLGQYDTQLEQALKQAIALGPWELSVQRTVTEVGLAVWYQLPKQVRWLILVTIERGMLSQANTITAIINKRRRIQIICAYIDLQRNTINTAIDTSSVANKKLTQLIHLCQK